MNESSHVIHDGGKKGGFDYTKLILPGAILVAAVLISGTLFYTKGTTLGTPPTQDGAVLTADNLKEWGKDIKLDTKQFNECLDNGKYKDEIAKDLSDGSAAGVTGTPTFFIDGIPLIGAQPYANFKLAIDAALAKTAVGEKSEVSVDDDPVLGNPNASVTVIEFSDFECPFCLRFFTETFEQLKDEYIDTGKVKLVYRDYPLTSIHPAAEISAEAAECAHEQGKFWEMHDKIFEEQG